MSKEYINKDTGELVEAILYNGDNISDCVEFDHNLYTVNIKLKETDESKICLGFIGKAVQQIINPNTYIVKSKLDPGQILEILYADEFDYKYQIYQEFLENSVKTYITIYNNGNKVGDEVKAIQYIHNNYKEIKEWCGEFVHRHHFYHIVDLYNYLEHKIEIVYSGDWIVWYDNDDNSYFTRMTDKEFKRTFVLKSELSNLNHIARESDASNTYRQFLNNINSNIDLFDEIMDDLDSEDYHQIPKETIISVFKTFCLRSLKVLLEHIEDDEL